jgi:vancomycin resistance protein YoaR
VTEFAARIVPRAWPRASTVFVVSLFLAAAAVYARALEFRGEALPGTRVAGVEVGGLDRAEAAAAIQTAVARRLAEPVRVTAGTKTIRVEPRRLFALDLVSTTDAALAASRRTEPERIAALVGSHERHLSPVLVLRAEATSAFVDEVRAAGGRAPRSATVELVGLEAVVTSSRDGLKLDAAGLIADLEGAALHGGDVAARFAPARARHLTSDARAAAKLAESLVSAPVHVFFERRPLRTLSETELATLVRFDERGSRFLVSFDPKRVERTLDPAIVQHERAPVNAEFAIVGKRVRIVPSQPGIGLDVENAAAEVAAAAYSPDRRIADARVVEVAPQVTTQELAAFGIREQISTFTTDMGVSSANRIWNVQLMADYIDGTIIEPGEVFSFNRVVGERTAERGFREGQMIVGSLLLPSIGGGVCQTATTLFNNVFEIGLPILRRYNHSFYISHYPLGRDATVSWGGPDLVFRNDLDNAILIKSSYTDSTLTFTFFGVDPGRRVVSTTSPQTNWRSPRTSYAYDPYAPAGSVRTSTGTNQMGFDVTVKRTVYENGRVLHRDSFASRYIPVGPTHVYGPGTNPPRVDFVLPPPDA